MHVSRNVNLSSAIVHNNSRNPCEAAPWSILSRAMGGTVSRLVRPLLAKLEPEAAHRLTIKALRWGLVRAPAVDRDARLAMHLFGLEFTNPVGLAAGADKNAEAPDGALGLGFGFVEVGTVTPEPQAGNPRPRLFRLVEDRAIINRMGFNNDGFEAVLAKLSARRGRGGIVGVNVGANRDSADRIGDYVKGLARFQALASYIAVNVSSPNTPGLRGLQARGELGALIARLNEVRTNLPRVVPLLIKIAPDLTRDQLADIAEVCQAGGIDGIIVSNTTVSRPPLRSRHASEPGGLSGRPLFKLSTVALAEMYRLVGGRIPLIGVGGIDSAEAAWAKITAGASLIQLYSALAFEGPELVTQIRHGLSRRLDEAGLASIAEAVGTTAEEWAETLP
jgi:dihydroorotate dehydrogenase